MSRFPVKSMAGELRTALEVYWPGVPGDRQYAFCRVDDRSSFPWLSARDLSKLVLYRPSYRDDGGTAHSAVDVLLPTGQYLALDDASVAARLSDEAGAEVRLMRVARGIFDAMPVSLASTTSLAAVNAAHGEDLDVRRFRLNIIIQSDQCDIDWRAGVLTFGERDDAAKLLVNEAIPRCALITIDPDTAERQASVMRTVAQGFGNKVGEYCATAKPGVIRVGDAVRLVFPDF